MEVTEKARERFWSKVQKSEGCWKWIGSCKKNGYGQVGYNYKNIYAHRFSFILHHNRDILTGMHILHSCDNRKCVNPGHLREGTHQENMKEMVDRGRALNGIKHRSAKLTEDDVREIRKQYAADRISQQQLANEYNVNQRLIWNIIHRKTWKHI